MRFQVLTAASMNMPTALWDIVLCSLIEVCRRFRGACCLHYQGEEWTGNIYNDVFDMIFMHSGPILNRHQTSITSTGFLDFVHHLVLWNEHVSEAICFRPQVKRLAVPTQLGPSITWQLHSELKSKSWLQHPFSIVSREDSGTGNSHLTNFMEQSSLEKLIVRSATQEIPHL
jgi:hypothetical protein